MVKVSIIIPAYNVESYIQRGIDSALAQTHSNVEVIIVNDGSTDGTWDVIKSYEAIDSRIVAIAQENQGVSAARNKGLLLATGTYIMFLDSDDWLEPYAVEYLLALQLQNKDKLVAVGLRYAKIKNDGCMECFSTPKENEVQTVSVSKALYSIGTSRYHLASACCKLFETARIKEHSLFFDQNIYHGEDGLFVFRYLRCCAGMVHSSERLWNILSRPDSASRSCYNPKMMTMITAAELMLKEYTQQDEVYRRLVVYRTIRTEGPLRFAVCLPEMPMEDIRIMRKKLRSQGKEFWRANRSILQALLYLCCAYFPLPLFRGLQVAWMKVRKFVR